MTVRTGEEIKAFADEFLPDNQTRLISPLDVRTAIIDLADSLTEIQTNPSEGGASSGSVGTSPKLGVLSPQVRLSLSSSLPVMTSDFTAATVIYGLPKGGNVIPLLMGSDFAHFQIPDAGVAIALDSNGAHTQNHGADSVFDLYATLRDGVPDLITRQWTSATARAIALAAAPGVGLLTNATGGTMRYGNSSGETLTVGANAGLFLGTFGTTGAAGQTEWTPQPSAAAGGSNNKLLLWNMYNRVRVAAYCRDSTTSWPYTTATIRAANGSASNRITLVTGLAEEGLDASFSTRVENDNAGIRKWISIGVDSTAAEFLREATVFGGAGENYDVSVDIKAQTLLGKHFYSANERSTATGTTTWYGSGALLLSLSTMM